MIHLICSEQKKTVLKPKTSISWTSWTQIFASDDFYLDPQKIVLTTKHKFDLEELVRRRQRQLPTVGGKLIQRLRDQQIKNVILNEAYVHMALLLFRFFSQLRRFVLLGLVG